MRYSTSMAQRLEESYQAWESACTLRGENDNYEYIVDFVRMDQTNQTSGTVRLVRRTQELAGEALLVMLDDEKDWWQHEKNWWQLEKDSWQHQAQSWQRRCTEVETAKKKLEDQLHNERGELQDKLFQQENELDAQRWEHQQALRQLQNQLEEERAWHKQKLANLTKQVRELTAVKEQLENLLAAERGDNEREARFR